MTGIGQIKQNAKDNLQGKWGLTVGVLLLGSLILGAVSFTVVGGLLLGGVMAYGISSYLLTVTRRQDSVLGTMFEGFNRFGTTCVTGILRSVFLFLWSLLFVIPGLVKSYSYAMTFYILRDDPTTEPLDAITKSREMMNGYKGKLFLLQLSFIGWYILSAFTFGLLYIFYVAPYYEASVAQFYEQLRADRASAPDYRAEAR